MACGYKHTSGRNLNEEKQDAGSLSSMTHLEPMPSVVICVPRAQRTLRKYKYAVTTTARETRTALGTVEINPPVRYTEHS